MLNSGASSEPARESEGRKIQIQRERERSERALDAQLGCFLGA